LQQLLLCPSLQAGLGSFGLIFASLSLSLRLQLLLLSLDWNLLQQLARFGAKSDPRTLYRCVSLLPLALLFLPLALFSRLDISALAAAAAVAFIIITRSTASITFVIVTIVVVISTINLERQLDALLGEISDSGPLLNGCLAAPARQVVAGGRQPAVIFVGFAKLLRMKSQKQKKIKTTGRSKIQRKFHWCEQKSHRGSSMIKFIKTSRFHQGITCITKHWVYLCIFLHV
jgi:hypothetical protein